MNGILIFLKVVDRFIFVLYIVYYIIVFWIINYYIYKFLFSVIIDNV